jgi:hypothetical protein
MLAQLDNRGYPERMREFRRHMIGLAAAAAAMTLLPSSVFAETAAGQTQVLRQLYTSGLARMAKADLTGAIDVFRVTAEVAPDLPQMHYSLGLALVLADWSQRDRALPSLEKALAADPGQPLFAIAKVLADPSLSHLGPDGALYLTPGGDERFRAAAAQLERAKGAVNGRYLRAVLSGIESTGDARTPARLAGFDRMLGQGGKVRLPRWNDSQAFARLFTVTVPEAQLQAYEPRMIARLQQGLGSLTPENLRRLQMKGRTDALRQQLSSAVPDGAVASTPES